MAKLVITVRLKNAPAFTFAASIGTAADLPRFLSSAAKAVRGALKVYPVVKNHAVERITVAPE